MSEAWTLINLQKGMITGVEETAAEVDSERVWLITKLRGELNNSFYSYLNWA